MVWRRLALVLMALVLSLPDISVAQDEEKVSMDTVVVTASRDKQQDTTVPAHVTVIDGHEIENSTAQNVPELLQSVGIHVSDVAGNRRSYWVDLRGYGESAPANTLVLVDGRRVNQPDLSAADWVLIPLDRIERIEIIRGGRGSVLYGDNASGGVINIITKEGVKNGGSAAFQYGSYETIKGAASASAVGDRWSLGLNGSYSDSDGYRENSSSEAKDLGLNLNYTPTDPVNLHVSSGYHKDSTRLPGALKQNELDAGIDRTDSVTIDDYANTEDCYLNAGINIDMLSNDSFKLDTAFRQRNIVFTYTYPTATYHYETEIDTIALSPQLIFRGDFGEVKNKIILGYDFVQAEEKISGDVDLDRIDSGYFMYDELQVAEGTTLSGGYRNDKARYAFSSADNSGEFLLKKEVFNAGINYAFAEGSHVYGSYAKSYRYPLLDELYSFYNQDFEDIKEQSSQHIEIGGSYQALASLRFNLSLFYIATDDEIFFNKMTYENTNLDGETVRQGFEAGVRWQAKGLGMGLSYKYTRAKVEDGQFEGSTIPDVPEHSGSADIYYAFKDGLRVGLNGQYIGERYFIADFDNSLKEQEAYFLLNGKIKYSWKKMVFFIDLNNLLDEEYSAYGVNDDPNGLDQGAYYPSPKFNWLVGVAIDI